jgi:MerR family mercuric resistance operon transcriptional regulator
MYTVYDRIMQIGKLAKQAGVSVQTVRFYERQKLLPEPARKDSGYRIYGPEHVKQLKFILQSKTLGFSLAEIREILEMRRRGQCPCTDVVGFAEKHLKEVQRQIDELSRFEDQLTRSLKQWRKAGDRNVSADAICVLIERTMNSNPINASKTAINGSRRRSDGRIKEAQ